MRPSPIEAARSFIEVRFPDCPVVLLAGSASRGEQKPNSDLDLILLDPAFAGAYRESFHEFGWRIEAFLHTPASIRSTFLTDANKGKPTMAHMCVSGIHVRDDGSAQSLKQAAQTVLNQGPKALTQLDIQASRYFLTDLLDDFIDADRYDEALITMNTLSLQIIGFFLRVNGQWLGRGKTLIRALRAYDEALSARYVEALNAYTRMNDKQPFIRLVDDCLEPVGGRLFEGFSMGKPQSNPNGGTRDGQ